MLTVSTENSFTIFSSIDMQNLLWNKKKTYVHTTLTSSLSTKNMIPALIYIFWGKKFNAVKSIFFFIKMDFYDVRRIVHSTGRYHLDTSIE